MSRESQTLKKGDLIAVTNVQHLLKANSDFHKKWVITTHGVGTSMASGIHTRAAFDAYDQHLPDQCMFAMHLEDGMDNWLATNVKSGKKQPLERVPVRYNPWHHKKLENKLVGIVTEIFSEEHPDLDIIKVREQKGGFRYCRRYILENV